MNFSALKFLTSPPKWVGKSAVSKEVIGEIPDLPAIAAC
jgi:hypothetical protein